MKLPYNLRCLGQPALTTPAGEPIRIRTKKHLALLVYLAVEGRRSHRRDDLAELLWSRAEIAEARHSLSTALSLFRARFGRDVIEANRDRIALKPGRIALDIDRLLAGQALGDEFTPPLEVAGFLDGFDIPDAPEFTLWKDRQQARLLPAIKQALVASIDCHRRTGEFVQIEAIADRMLALDDLSEEAIRAKMEARALAGDRITALRVFEEWSQKLATELQAAPSDELHRMATALRSRRWQRSSPADRSASHLEQRQDRPFIGRQAEYLSLHNAWEQTHNGTPVHVLVLGDSGVGKSTLVQRFADAVALEGTSVVRVQCYDVEREIPYSTLSTLVDELITLPGASGTPPEALAQLCLIAPSIRKQFSVVPTLAESRGEASRIRTTEAFLDLLRAVADDHHVLLIIDDFHFADDASLASLHLIMRRTRGERISMLFISRPGDLPLSPQASLLRDNKAAIGISEISIDPLGELESETLLRRLIPDDHRQPNTATRRALLRAAAGYPMALELLTQDWLASGAQCHALSINAITENVSFNHTTDTYKRILERISSTLQPHTRKVLNLASILGSRISDITMYDILEMSHNDITNAIIELTNRRLLRDNGSRVEFINELIRNTAYLAIPSPIRKHLHSRVADRFLEAEKAWNIDLGLEIAWHCTRAGRHDEVAEPLIRGARSAMRYGAPYLAEQALVSALPMLGGQPKTEATLLLAEAMEEQSRWQDLLEVLDEVDHLADRPNMESAHIFRLTARRRLGEYNGTEHLRRFASQLVDFLYSSLDTSSRLRAAIEAASALQIIKCDSLATQILDAIATIPLERLDDIEKPQLLLARAMANFSIANYGMSMEDAQTALHIMREQQTVNSTLAMLQSGLGSLQTLLWGDYQESSKQLRLAAETATRIGNERIFNLAAANLSVVHSRLGEYEESIRWAEISISYSYELHSAACQGILASTAMLNNARAVEDIINRWTQPLREQYSQGVSQAWDLFCADAYLILGETTKAEEHARQATSSAYNGLILDYCVGAYARWIAQLAVRDSNTAEAMDALSQLQNNLTRYHAMDQVEILTAIAWLEHQQGTTIRHPSKEINKRLDTLPIGVREQLTRMKMLVQAD